MKTRIILTAVAASLSLTFAVPAFSHGDQHKPKTTTAPVKAEQKAFGIAGDPKKVTRTIAVTMSDAMRFSPTAIDVKQGETIKFVAKNDGKLMHEMVIGTLQDLKEHAEMMKKFPDMEHDEPYMAHVAPGKTEEIVWQFNRPGEFHFACLVAGHFEAGMIGKVSVAGMTPVADVTAKPSSGAQTSGPMTKGEVKKVDKDAGKLTIKHEPLQNLGMPAMTMIFRVKDPVMLDQVKPGDNIRFSADKVNGAYTVVQLETIR